MCACNTRHTTTCTLPYHTYAPAYAPLTCHRAFTYLPNIACAAAIANSACMVAEERPTIYALDGFSIITS